MTDAGIKTYNNDKIPTSIAPWLSVRDIMKALEFYKSAFAAIETYRLEAPDGSLQVAKLSVDGAAFWLSEASTQQDNPGPESSDGGTIRMILTVTDPDAFFEQALKAGALPVFPVGEEHGWRLGRIADPFGHHWEIGRMISS
jgi:PhnB protein